MPRTAPTSTRATDPAESPRIAELARCLDCGAGLAGRASCPGCGRSYPESDGILGAIGPLAGRNRIAARFYDGPGWARFRPWERLFLRVQGGKGRARRQILRHLHAPPLARVLEVGIGDGENVDQVPGDWTVYGVDIARAPLRDALRRRPGLAGRLALAEGEALPFADGTFDAAWSIGGFNYFRDHAAALREMKRVTRPGGSVVVADEVPDLHRLGIGHLIGVPRLDAAWLRALGLDREFADMVLGLDLDPAAVVESAWPGASKHRIWGGLGYCFVHADTAPDPESAGQISPPPGPTP